MSDLVVLRMDVEQAEIVSRALELYSRLGMGQLEIVLSEELTRWSLLDREKLAAFNEHVNGMKQLLGHASHGSYGIYNVDVPWICREAYDIHQVVRNTIATHKNVDRLSVARRDYAPAHSKLPAIKAEVQDPLQQLAEADLDSG